MSKTERSLRERSPRFGEEGERKVNEVEHVSLYIIYRYISLSLITPVPVYTHVFVSLSGPLRKGGESRKKGQLEGQEAGSCK